MQLPRGMYSIPCNDLSDSYKTFCIELHGIDFTLAERMQSNSKRLQSY